MYALFKRVDPTLHKPDPSHPTQVRWIETNFFLLPFFQVLWDVMTYYGLTRVTMGNTAPLLALRDAALWMLGFEWAWYFQHRLMHDVKPCWKLGHSHHHTWRKPAHMIGITNFAFDHVVEPWVYVGIAVVVVVVVAVAVWCCLLLFSRGVVCVCSCWLSDWFGARTQPNKSAHEGPCRLPFWFVLCCNLSLLTEQCCHRDWCCSPPTST